MTRAQQFLAALSSAGIRSLCGVPDSLLAGLIDAISDQWPTENHVIAPNEGTAVALAVGHYLATQRPAAVYMQNSGLGNAANPLISLADPQVYGIPMVLVIGWRGEVAADGSLVADEPQHRAQGRITPALLDLLGIPFQVLDRNSDLVAAVAEAVRQASSRQAPVALLVRKGTFDAVAPAKDVRDALMSREEAIAVVLQAVAGRPLVVTTGMASREVFELRRARGDLTATDFLTVGGMGHAVGIAVGLARSRPGSRIVCLDGDGAVLMHMGALALAARTDNLMHVVINNGAHDSVGGQPTLAAQMPLRPVAEAVGYAATAQVNTARWLQACLADFLDVPGSVFVEVTCRTGHRPDLGRPTVPPVDARRQFVAALGGDDS